MMNRFLALLLALLFACVTVSSACTAAADNGWIHFTLEPSPNGDGKIQARFRGGELERHDNDWSAGFMPSDLIGLDLAGFRLPGSQPLRFALVREAGRLDCAGNGGGSLASGNCRFTPDAAFTQMLASRGVGRPTKEQALGLMALDARRDILEAVATAHYPAPTIDDLMSLTAVGVTGPYISQMAQVGYRPKSIEALIEFKALNITPQWIGGFVRAGYANVPGDELVQLKAMNITPDYVAGFERAGYPNLPVDTLVQLKALNITPDFVRWASAGRSTMPPVNDLVEMKIFGRKR